MHGKSFLLAVVLSAAAGSMTDWLFMGMLFHKKYLETPEIWRSRPGQSEAGKITVSTLLGTLASAIFLFLGHWTGAIHSIIGVLSLAVLVTIMGPVPVILSNLLYVKMSPWLGLSHSLGWLARFGVTGFLGMWLLS